MYTLEGLIKEMGEESPEIVQYVEEAKYARKNIAEMEKIITETLMVRYTKRFKNLHMQATCMMWAIGSKRMAKD